MSIGVPIKLIHEAETHTVTVELKSGELYRGILVEAEDNMNISMSNVTMTGRDGSKSTLEQVFIRGGLMRYIILPDILKNAPMFKRIDPKVGILRGKGVGIGRSTMARAKRGGPGGGGGDRGGGGGGGGGGPRGGGGGRGVSVRG